MATKGIYARMFEEEYRRFATNPKYQALFGKTDPAIAAEEAHDGYFSIDRKGGWTDTREGNQRNREDAERAYSLIMREKEKLLDLETPLKFIFSHSALREGWDNPNVFQICTLRDIRSERERRQTVGRGLRLCVNRTGERVRGFDVNTLTVIATESYEEFAANLQHEIEVDAGMRFGMVDAHQFVAIPTIASDGETTALGLGESRTLYNHLQAMGYVDAEGRIQDSLRRALREDNLELPEKFAAQRPLIVGLLRKFAGGLDIKNASDRRVVRPRQAVLDSADFSALWDRIKHKTTYRVAFNNESLLRQCTVALRDGPAIPMARLQWRKADIAIGRGGSRRHRDGWGGDGPARRVRY